MKKIILLLSLLTCAVSSRAQFVFNPLSYIPANAGTYWNPTNVLGTFTLNPHLVQISCANLPTTNTLTVAVRMGIDNTYSNYPVTFFTFTNNALFTNNLQGGGPVSSNGTYTIYIPQQSIAVYGSAFLATTNFTGTNAQAAALL